MKFARFVLALAPLIASAAPVLSNRKGPWPAETFKLYPATDALSEAKARFQILNEYALAFLFWRVEIELDPPFGRGGGTTIINWLKVESSDPVWGPWIKLARLSRLEPSEIRFGSERREPGSFLIDGQVRIAKTGSRPGTPIIVNEDLITRLDANRELVPLDYPEIIAILVHEHGHHLEALGVRMPHEELDRHGSLVRAFLEEHFRQLEYGLYPPDPVLPAAKRPMLVSPGFHEDSMCDLRLFFVKDETGIRDLTPLFDNEKMCLPHPERRAPHLYPPLVLLAPGTHTVEYSARGGALEGILRSSDYGAARLKAILRFDDQDSFRFREIRLR